MKLKFKIAFTITTILAIFSWIIAAYYWDKLPSVIPTHFGISGLADGWSDKSIFQVFLLPFIQSLMLALFVFVYHRPQYSNIPSTMWLAMLDSKHKEHAYDLIRTMHIGVFVLVGLMFTYITYGMNYSALNNNLGLSTPVLLTIIGLMIIWLIYWTVKIYRETKSAITSFNKN